MFLKANVGTFVLGVKMDFKKGKDDDFQLATG